MRVHRYLAAAAVAAACASGQAQALKPGLWEVTNKMGGNAQMDQAMAEMQKQMAAMPPEQRRQMEAMMQQRGMQMPGAGPGGAMSMKLCMTREMAERKEMPMQQGCTITKLQASGNTTNLAFTCASPPSSGEGQFTAMGPDAYASRMTVRTVVQGKQETMTMDGTGKWLGADCGSVQPPQMPKK
ncbi:MAG: DUF3617 domain-containing protein [Burkholderiales bacterium]|nr:DUF3617 domain-containing protein [Burkholderiales bacterium]